MDNCLNCYYDLSYAPNSFDFAYFLSLASSIARINGLSSLNVYVISKEFRRVGIEASYTEAYSRRKVWDIFPSISSLFPMVRFFQIILHDKFEVRSPCFPPLMMHMGNKNGEREGRIFFPHSPIFLEKIHQKYNVVSKINLEPTFTKSEQNKLGDYVTYSPRNSVYCLERNTSYIQSKTIVQRLSEVYGREAVVIVPDREDLNSEAFDSLGVTVDRDAASSLSRRYSLYSGSKLNVAYSGGANSLLLISDFPYFYVGIYNSSNSISSKDFFSRKGPTFGKQLPWANENQSIDWTDYAEENLHFELKR